MKRVETSKKILIYCDLVTLLIVIAAFILSAVGSDMTGISEISVAFIGLTAAAHSFYFWKAKAENLHKRHLDDKITMNEGDNGCGL